MWCRKTELMAETYIVHDFNGEKKYCCFPNGYKTDSPSKYLMFSRTAPLQRGDAGYDETHCSIRGLEILTLNLNIVYNLELNPANVLIPIYVVSLSHFLNKSVRYREGQRHIFGIQEIWRKDALSPGTHDK